MKRVEFSHSDSYSVALIVGGLSKRFGSLKQLAELNQQRLLDYSLNLARRFHQDIMLITGPHRFNRTNDIPQYQDLILHKGPMGGILTALHYCETSYCLMIPCDMPFLDKQIYDLLLQYLPSEVPVVARSHRGIEPLVSIWPKSIEDKIRLAVEQDKLKLFLFLQEAGALFVNVKEQLENYNPLWFSNVNTREDLERLKRYHAR